MDGSRPVDPLEELRRANPAGPHNLPAASVARVRATVMEDLNREKDPQAAPATRSPRRPLALGLAGLIGAAAVVVGVVGLGSAPGALPPASGGPKVGLCVETYTPETLGHRTFAFDGTVVSVNGDAVTFRVEAPFKGVDEFEFTVTAIGMTGGAITPNGGLTLAPGQRFLVAGEAGFAWGCGFTSHSTLSSPVNGPPRFASCPAPRDTTCLARQEFTLRR